MGKTKLDVVMLAAICLSVGLAPGGLSVAEQQTTSPAPRVVHVPNVELVGTVDPSGLPQLDTAPSVTDDDTGVLVPNVFPSPAELGERLPTVERSGAPDRLTLVTAPSDLVDAGTDALPTIDVRFDGPYQSGIAPPDPVMAAGSSQVVSLINSRFAVYDKAGALLDGPVSLRSFFGIPSSFSIFDPLAIHDPFSDRFVVAVIADDGFAQDARIYIAFTASADATATWNKYFIDADRDQAANWADYASIGIDRNAVYVTANMFMRSGGFSNVTLFVYDKEDGYAGVALDNTHLIDVRSSGGGSPFRLRPGFVGEVVPNDEYYLMQASSGFSSSMELFRLTGDRFGSPSISAESIGLPAFYFGPGGARQPGGSSVDTLGGSLWNVYYRAGTVWTAQAISGSVSIAAWVHRVDVSSTPAVRETTYEIEESGRDTYFPHIVPDTEDNDFAMLSAYSGSDLQVTGRYWNIGADGTVRTTELLASGTRSNESGRHGDYFSMYADPIDRNRVWMIAQYMQNSSFSGNQKIASVRFEDEAGVQGSLPTTPNGNNVPGEQLLVSKAAGNDVTITWGAAECAPADNHLVWFDLAGLASYTIASETCDIGLSRSWTGTPPGGSVAAIVVTDDDVSTEGSHGFDSRARERPSAAAVCASTKRTDIGCQP
ncbi:MAG: hypothetical protein JSV80_16960 [Acidobacteriota bacterium]|nr:MAG: hypothetical protein JSV80_16960 [Acidobacteriota bacterium]